MTKFNLSEKGVRVASIKAFGHHANGFIYFSRDYVKEFIRLLKEEYKQTGVGDEDTYYAFINFIDKLAGPQLL